jgi:hypothetical protein
MQKILLSETKLIYGEINKIAKVDISQIEQSIQKEKVSDDIFNVRNLYHKINFIQGLERANTYLVDHYQSDFNEPLYLNQKDSVYALNQPKGQSIEWHTHFDDYDVLNSPDYICIYCLSNTETPIDLVIEYSDHRDKKRLWKIDISKNQYKIFNGDLRFKLMTNNNNNDVNYIVFKYFSK